MDLISYLLVNKELIEIISNIFTSIGTVGTVIVALYLSYKSNHPKAKIRAKADFNYFHQHSDLQGTDGTPVISIDIANISIAPIEINALGWTLGFSKRFINKKVMYQLPKEIMDQISCRLPATIPFGQNIQIFIEEVPFINNAIASFPINKHCHVLNALNSYFCYLFIQDSIGNFYYFRIEKTLRKKILDAIDS